MKWLICVIRSCCCVMLLLLCDILLLCHCSLIACYLL